MIDTPLLPQVKNHQRFHAGGREFKNRYNTIARAFKPKLWTYATASRP